MKERQKEKGIRGNGVGLWREAAGASGADGLVGVAGGSSGGWVGAVDVCSWAAVGGVTAYQSYRCSAPSAWLKTGLQVLPYLRFLLRSQCHQGDGIGQASHSWQSRSGRGAVPAEAAGLGRGVSCRPGAGPRCLAFESGPLGLVGLPLGLRHRNHDPGTAEEF